MEVKMSKIIQIILNNLSHIPNPVKLSSASKIAKVIAKFFADMKIGDLIEVTGIKKGESLFLEAVAKDEKNLKRNCWSGLVIGISDPKPEVGIYNYGFKLDCGVELSLPDCAEAQKISMASQITIARCKKYPAFYLVDAYNNNRSRTTFSVNEELIRPL